MLRLVLLITLVFNVLPKDGAAQQGDALAWVQIEARPTLEAAQERVEAFAGVLQDVNGFAMQGGWYAITLGPYTAADAEEVLRSYRAQGLIPSDSYIAATTIYGQQFWPPGEDLLGRGTLTQRGLTAQTTDPAGPRAPREETALVAPEQDTETPAEARRSESLLSAQERRDLQTALQWAGFYDAAIDGAFGRGTRASMGEWQSANGFEVTGILTTRQRAVLMGQYNAVFEGLGMRVIRNAEAGIEVRMPAALVGFTRLDPPFARYDALENGSAQVLLISQAGDADTLKSLYDIMQTLTIVPLDGPRDLGRNSFSIIGRNADITSETQVTLSDGALKGFTLIWPAGDETRRLRVVQEMQASFTALPGLLDPAAGAAPDQQIDLLAGLEVRTPRLSRSGFYVDGSGAVVTTAEAVQSCTRITLDDVYEATLTDVDTARGVALLRPTQTLAPPAVANFSVLPPRLRSEIAVAGYSFEGQLGGPSVTFGTLSDVKGLQGEADVNRLSIEALPGDVGGPVFDGSGNVFGMLLPQPDGARQLPQEVRFALAGDAIAGLMDRAGLRRVQATNTDALHPLDITDRGVAMTVLVSCWE